MTDKYGTPITIGSRVARWLDDRYIYGTVQEPTLVSLADGNENVQVKFDNNQFDSANIYLVHSFVELINDEDLIVCDPIEAEHEVSMTFTVAAYSKFQAYDAVKRWQDKLYISGDPYPHDCVSTEIKPKL
jgi:hypothetical protein